MSREFDIPKSHVIVAGIEYRLLGSAFAAGGQASLYEAVAKNSDVSRRFLIKRFHDSGDYSEEFESEELSQKVAVNVHQAILAAAFHDKKQHTSVMLKASSDCSTVQDILIAWEDVPPEDPASDYFHMGRFLESIQIVKSLLGALSGIHKHGVLHMDVSPSNVMWGRTVAHGTAYLLDFSCCTKIGSIVGERRRTTLSFSSPEAQIPGTVLTPAADIYSVGAVFLLLVAGMAAASNNRSEKKWSIRRLPGEGNTNVTDRVDDLDIPDAYKGKLSEIIIKATTSVDRRYQSAEEMLADIRILEEIIQGIGVHPEVLLVNSEQYYEKIHCKGLDPDLFVRGINYRKEVEIKVAFDRETGGMKWDHRYQMLEVTAGKEHCTLIADGGSGKTTTLHNLWRLMLERQTEQNASIPLYVDLAPFSGLAQSPWYIHDYILTNYAGISQEDIEKQRVLLDRLFKKGKYTIILDGYNEAQKSTELNEEIGKLSQMSGVKLVVASRFVPHDSCIAQFSQFTLEALSEQLVNMKMSVCGKSVCSTRLYYVLQKPMYLAAYIGLGQDVSPKTPGEIIYEHILKLKEKVKVLGHSSEYDLRDFAVEEALPQWAYHADSMTFDYVWAKNKLAQLPAGERFDRVGNKTCASVLDALCHMGILQKEANGKYRFIHQNYRDVFRSVYIANRLKRGIIDESLTKGWINSEDAAFLGDILKEGDCSLENSCKKSYIEHAIVSLKGRTDEDAKLALCNLIEVLKISRSSRLNICLDGCDLSLANFQGCDLSGSTFRNSKLPVLGFLRRGHLHTVDHMAHVPKADYLLTYSQMERKICLWNIKTGELQKTIYVHIAKEYTEGNKLAISPNGKFVAIRNHHLIAVYSLSTGGLVHLLEVNDQVEINAKISEWLRSQDMCVDIVNPYENILCFCNARELIVNIDKYLVKLSLQGKLRGFFCLGDIDEKGLIKDAYISKKHKQLFLTSGKGVIFQLSSNLGIERKRFETDNFAELVSVSDNNKYLATSYLGDSWSSAIFDISGDEPKLIRSGRGQACVSDRYSAQYSIRDGVVWIDNQSKEAYHEKEAVGALCGCISLKKAELYVSTYNNELYIYDLKHKCCKNSSMLGCRYVSATHTRYTGYRGIQWASAQASYLPIAITDDGAVAIHIPGCSTTIYKAGGVRGIPYAREGYYSRFDGEYYLVGRENYQLDVFSLQTGELVASTKGDPEKCLGNTYHSWGPCLHYIQATYLPEYNKVVAVTTDDRARVWDQKLSAWKNLDLENKAPYETKLFWTPRFVDDYPWKEATPLHCVVLQNQILTLTRDHYLRVWSIDGDCLFENRCDAINILWYKVAKLIPIPGTRYCVFFCYVKKKKDPRIIYTKPNLSYVIRVWDAENLCFAEERQPEFSQCIPVDSLVSPSIRPDSILSFKEYTDPLIMIEQKLFPAEQISFIRSIDGVLAWSKDAYIANDRIVFFSKETGIRIYERKTGVLVKTIAWATIADDRIPVLDVKVSKNGLRMGVALSDGSCYAINLDSGTVESNKALTVAAIDGCDFTGAYMDNELSGILKKHGAIVDSPKRCVDNKK